MAQVYDVYPTEILPRVIYKRRLNVGRLLERYPDLLVVRMVDGFVNDYLQKSESGDIILSQKVFKNNMANLSMNLAGALFDTSSHAHLRFLPTKKEATDAWNGLRIPKRLYSTTDCFDTHEPCFGLCFLVNEINERTFPFHKHFESEEERNAFADRASNVTTFKEKEYQADYVSAFESKKKNVLVRPRIKVHHAPSKVNYWHMTLDTYRPTDMDFVRPDEKQDSSDVKMFKALKQNLVLCCKINEGPTYNIEKRDYYKPICFYFWMLFSKL